MLVLVDFAFLLLPFGGTPRFLWILAGVGPWFQAAYYISKVSLEGSDPGRISSVWNRGVKLEKGGGVQSFICRPGVQLGLSFPPLQEGSDSSERTHEYFVVTK